MDMDRAGERALQAGRALVERGFMLVVAESCTGGLLASTITSLPGSSAWFERGFVAYSNAAKQDMLGVRVETLTAHGSVSEQTVREMAAGALVHSEGRISIAISGVAGPGGGSIEKPVGLIWLAWARAGPARGRAGGDPRIVARRENFSGDRRAVREQAVMAALDGLLDIASEARAHHGP